jgi:hypothetical protein
MRARDRHEQGIEIESTPTESDRQWVEELIEKRGWPELRKRP